MIIVGSLNGETEGMREMFAIAAAAAMTLIIVITMISCISMSPAFGAAAMLGIVVGLGAGWARRAA